MKQEFVLGKIDALMDWTSEEAASEFAWLRLMSRMKYDDYQDFLAGIRFLESLADWLQQFPQHERQYAYNIVRTRLVFFSAKEMHHLVELFYPETVEPRLMTRAAELANVPRYELWEHEDAEALYYRILRKSIFVELSDGARADILRRLNEQRISNEQVVTTPQITKQKWNDMLNKLRKDLHSEDEKFACVFLIDDFTASGTTLLRKEGVTWKGKLQRFWDEMHKFIPTHLEPDWRLVVHHYIKTSQACSVIRDRNQRKTTEAGPEAWFERVDFSHGVLLPSDFRIRPEDDPDLKRLITNYYDPSIETEHIKRGGADARWGFGDCGLPLVLEHNTPNNSLSLLWAETDNPNGHSMRPLFRRRQRHL